MEQLTNCLSMCNHFVGLAVKALTLPCIILKNDQTYFKNLALLTLQDFRSMFGHFSVLCIEGLMLMFPSKAIDWFIEQLTEAYSEPSRTSKIEPFVKIVNHFQKVVLHLRCLTGFWKRLWLDLISVTISIYL